MRNLAAAIENAARRWYAADAGWLGAFLPGLASGEPASLFTPAIVSDAADGQIAHLHGLNLSRAWCWSRRGGRADFAVHPPHRLGRRRRPDRAPARAQPQPGLVLAPPRRDPARRRHTYPGLPRGRPAPPPRRRAP